MAVDANGVELSAGRTVRFLGAHKDDDTVYKVRAVVNTGIGEMIELEGMVGTFAADIFEVVDLSGDEAEPPRIGLDDLPRWKCHKVVRASKITQLERRQLDDEPPVFLVHVEDLDTPIEVPQEYLTKRPTPAVGGYFVLYRDGYMSWSPASEFDDGYDRL